MRIVAGRFAGRDLVSPQDQRVRPTAEAVRDALMTLLKAELKDARVLDLFAGTGALGLEAISRGARGADFVEFKPDSLHALRANIAALGVRDQVRVFKRDAIPFAEGLAEGSYDLAFADPPYGSKMLDRVVQSWLATRFARIFAVEHARAHELPKARQRRVFDDTALSIYKLTGSEGVGE